MRSRLTEKIMLLIFLLLFNSWFSQLICRWSFARSLDPSIPESSTFRSQYVPEKSIAAAMILSEKSELSLGEVLTLFHAAGKISDPLQKETWSLQDLIFMKRVLTEYNPEGYRQVREAYEAIWNDLVCMPVTEQNISFENSWMFERSYGGIRGHEGTDLIPEEDLAGYYPIVSMTDGIVEAAGWLEQGGNRIGIRSPSGGYYYYAHLETYSRNFQIGEYIEAGTILGTMGNTGYGPPGTRGQFPVHLHLGIYIRTETMEEVSINPYWILRSLQMTSDHSS